jgi:hypothetical protein
MSLYQIKGGGVICPDSPYGKVIITGNSDQLNIKTI